MKLNLKLTTTVCLIVIGVLHSGLVSYTAYSTSATFDEPGHLVAGLAYYEFGQFGLYRVNPPLPRLVAAAPVLLAGAKTEWRRYHTSSPIRREFQVGADFALANGTDFHRYLFLARLAMLPFSLMGLIVCFVFSQRVWGGHAGLVSAALWGFCPLVIGHAALITTDIAGAATGLLCVWRLWEWCQARTIDNALLAGLACGVALLCKTSSVILIPLFLMLLCVSVFRKACSWRSAAEYGFAFVGTTWVLLNAGYLFQGTGRPLGEIPFISRHLTADSDSPSPDKRNRFQGTVFGSVPVPFPTDFVRGIDVQKHDFERRRTGYLHGEQTSGRHWYYVLYALATKLSVVTLLLLAASCVFLKERLSRVSGAWIIPFTGLIWLMFVMSGLAMDDHCRYALPAVACLFVWLGSFWRDRSGSVTHGQSAPEVEVEQDPVSRSGGQSFGGRGRVPTAALVSGVLALQAFMIAPHFLSQTNFAAARLDTSFHYSGSDLAWGQGLMELRDWCSDRGISEPIGLLYCGSIDPSVYGLHWQLPELQQPFPQWVFVSTNLVCPPRQAPVYQPQGRTKRMSVARLLDELSEFQVDDPPKGFVAFKTR